MRAAVLPYIQRDSRDLQRSAEFFNFSPDRSTRLDASGQPLPSGVAGIHVTAGVYRFLPTIDVATIDCNRDNGLDGFRDGYWYCVGGPDPFYYHRADNTWAGSGFCDAVYDVLPPLRGRSKLRVHRGSDLGCLDIPDTAPAHDLDGFEGRGTVVVKPLPDNVPAPVVPTTVRRTAKPPTNAPPPPRVRLPRLPHHSLRRHRSSDVARTASHYGCRPYPGIGNAGWLGPYWDGYYDRWYWLYVEDCRAIGRLLGLRGGAAQNLQYIITAYAWNGYQAVRWYEVPNPEYSGTGGEVGACFAGSCTGHFS